ncbi:cobalt ECF transporter T component CbiQ [Paenibacillus sp. y28]|uniref:cobalt ECF transporter T component CbiQ n=1 Tax=Paenibacillus sp. y28 TaxID=3129110 RepID=UPI003016496A
MMQRIDTISYTNKLRAVSPLWKSGLAALLFVLAYAAHPVVQLAIGAWMSLWIIGYARIPARFYLMLLGSSCLFYMASLPALLVQLTPAGQAADGASLLIQYTAGGWTAYVTESGLETALTLLVRIAACLSCMFFVTLTTPMPDLFQVMGKLKLPPLLLELMLIMYRFIFLLSQTARDMYTAQRARGGQAGFKGRLNDTALLIVRIFGKTMQRYRGLSFGLMARGFTGDIRMAPYEPKGISFRYKAESGAGVLLLLLLELWLRWRG